MPYAFRFSPSDLIQLGTDVPENSSAHEICIISAERLFLAIYLLSAHSFSMKVYEINTKQTSKN